MTEPHTKCTICGTAFEEGFDGVDLVEHNTSCYDCLEGPSASESMALVITLKAERDTMARVATALLKQLDDSKQFVLEDHASAVEEAQKWIAR